MDLTLASASQAQFLKKRLNLFERYLTLWVALCMIGGVLLGQSAPGAVQWLRNWEFGKDSHVNAAIAVLIWLMIIPMMMKVDVASIRTVGKRPIGLFVTLFVNWVVKPFSMAFFAWVLFPTRLLPLDCTERSRSIHSRNDYFGSGTLHCHGLRLELFDRRRSRLHSGASVGQ
jgi:ACR3 family arsenite efflux pump ArsB